MDALNVARITNATYSIGITRAALDAAIDYSNKRKAFGKSISEFQGVSFRLADIATNLEAAKLLRDKAAWMMDQDLDVTKEAAMAKLFASELATSATSECLQIFGGIGYTYLTRMQRYFRDARMTTIGDGTSNIMRYVIARRIDLNIRP
jgi:alkylation response protein AidB-like acyl-CoA dehydrogenase